MKSSRLEVKVNKNRRQNNTSTKLLIKFLTMVPFFTLMFTVLMMCVGVAHDGPVELGAMTLLLCTVFAVLVCDVNWAEHYTINLKSYHTHKILYSAITLQKKQKTSRKKLHFTIMLDKRFLSSQNSNKPPLPFTCLLVLCLTLNWLDDLAKIIVYSKNR